MPAKCKITVEVPAYLKAWINAHDVSQNALVVMGLRKLYKEEQQPGADQIVNKIIAFFKTEKLPF